MTKRVLAVLAFVAVWLPIAGRAQQVTEDELEIEVGKVQVEECNWDDVYPTIRRLRGVNQGGREEYLRIAVQFRLNDRRNRDRIRREGDPWLGAMDVDWVVVAARGREGRNDPRPEYSPRFTRTVRYANIKGGEAMWVMIFIHPSTRDRWMKDLPTDQIYYQVTFRYANRTRETIYGRGEDYATKAADAPGQARQWIETEATLRIPDQLLHRYETPFAYASDDMLPMIVQQPEQR